LYKVFFDNNKPVSATETDLATIQNRSDSMIDENQIIRWLPVFGLNKQDALKIGGTVINDYI